MTFGVGLKYESTFVGLLEKNHPELAKKSGVERTHLYRKLKTLGIKIK